MELLSKLQTILKDITFDTRAIFTGIYREEEPVSVYSTIRDKEKIISELTGLLVRKALISSSDLMENFKPEFLFAEGKEFGIFIYIVEGNIAIATLINEKPNFSLLKMTHENTAKKLSSYIEEIKEYNFKIKESSTSVEKNKEKEEVEVKEKVEENVSEVEELEKILSGEEAQETTSVESKENLQEPVKAVEEKEQIEEEVEAQEEVPLEEILGVKEAEVSEEVENIDELIEDIRKEFIKEIGPVGKIIFNKTLKSLKIKENPTMNKLKEFIDLLAQEISVEKRRAEFIRDTKKIIGG